MERRKINQIFTKILNNRKYYYLLALLIILVIQPCLFINIDNLTLWSVYKFYFDLGLTPYEVFKINNKLFVFHAGEKDIYMWFAYPPLAFYLLIIFTSPYLLFKIKNLYLQIILARLHSIFSYFILAYLIYFIVYKITNDKNKAKRAEKFILFNPFVIIVSVIQGLYDTWICVFFLVFFYLLIIKKRPDYAGIVFSMGLLVKQYLIFIFPFVIIYILKNFGAKNLIRFLTFFIGTSFLIFYPLFSQFPEILEIAFLFHLERPAQVINLPILLYLPIVFDKIFNINLLSISVIAKLQEIVSLIIIGIFEILLFFILLFRKRKFNDFEFLYYSLIFFVIFLIGYKVVNPQHYILAYVLLLLLYFKSGNKTFLEISKYLSLLAFSLFVMFIILGSNVFINYKHVSTSSWYFNLIKSFIELCNFVFNLKAVLLLLIIILPILYFLKKSYLPLLEMLFSALRLRYEIDKKSKIVVKSILFIYVFSVLLFCLLYSFSTKFIYNKLLSKLNSSTNTSIIKIKYNSSKIKLENNLELKYKVEKYYKKNFEIYACITSGKYFINQTLCQL